MLCPFCGAGDTRVIDSRLANEGSQVRRRRQCPQCGERFTTYETVELTLPRLVKRDGRREAFDEDKLRRAMLTALEKRPVRTEYVEDAIGRLRRRLVASGEREVSTRRLGDWVMDELRRLDQVAYIRFASVYLSFDDIEAFRELVERLEKEPPPEARRHQISLLDGDDFD